MNRFKIHSNGPSLGPNSGLKAFDGSELIVQSSSGVMEAITISVLAAGFGAVLTDGGHWPATGLGAGPTRLWVMADTARSWSLDARLHLSYESFLTLSDRKAWERVGFERLKTSCQPLVMARNLIQQRGISCKTFLKGRNSEL